MKNKKLIRVQPIYTMVIWFIAFCILIFFIFLPQLLKWEGTKDKYIIWYCLIGTCAFVSLLIFIYYLQFAYISKDGIIIKGIFYKIAQIRWEDICCISYEKLITYDNRENIFLKWMVIKMAESEFIHGRAGRNRKGKSPWCIVATKKNIEIISQYFPITEKTI